MVAQSPLGVGERERDDLDRRRGFQKEIKLREIEEASGAGAGVGLGREEGGVITIADGRQFDGDEGTRGSSGSSPVQTH